MKEEDFKDDFSGAATDFFNQLMGPKSDSSKKICNLAVNHLTRCEQILSNH